MHTAAIHAVRERGKPVIRKGVVIGSVVVIHKRGCHAGDERRILPDQLDGLVDDSGGRRRAHGSIIVIYERGRHAWGGRHVEPKVDNRVARFCSMVVPATTMLAPVMSPWRGMGFCLYGEVSFRKARSRRARSFKAFQD